MKYALSENSLVVTKEFSDPPYYGVVNAKGESNLLHAIKKDLNKHGFDLIKKRMWKDGHLVDDLQQYLRVKSANSDTPHLALWNSRWAMFGLNDKFNQSGECVITVSGDFFHCQPDWFDRAKKIMEKIDGSRTKA